MQLDDGPLPASKGTKNGADLRGPTSGGYRSEVAAAVANAAALRNGAVSTSSSSSSSVPAYTSILSGTDFEATLAAKATASNRRQRDPRGLLAAGGSAPAGQGEYDRSLFNPTPEAAVN